MTTSTSSSVPDGLRVAHPLRMLFGLAGHFSQHRLEQAAEDAWHLGLLRPDHARRLPGNASVARGRGGVLRFERWLDHALERNRPSQSGFEIDVVRAATRAGLPDPERQFELTLPSGELIHLDLAWPVVRLGVEPGHSWWHGGDLQMERDAARDRACDMIGWRIMRYPSRRGVISRRSAPRSPPCTPSDSAPSGRRDHDFSVPIGAIHGTDRLSESGIVSW